MADFRGRSGALAVVTSVASPAVSTSLVAANKLRKTLILQNTSTSILYARLDGGTADATSGHSLQLAANTNVILEGFTGAVTGIHSAANGQINITEIM